MSDTRDAALVLGASRGLGLAICEELIGRGWGVVATVRGETPLALRELASKALPHLTVEQLDVVDAGQLADLRRRLEGRRFDLILANAGVCTDIDATMATVPNDRFTQMMLTNALGPVRALEVLQDLVPAGGVLSAMSSILGSQTENAAGIWAAYAASKAALNMLLHDFAGRHAKRRAVIAMAPGWVRTEMGGQGADLSIAASVPRVVDVLTAQRSKPGLRYLNYDGRVVAW